jgi:hypothetical protein
MIKRQIHYILLLAVVVLALCVYYPGLTGYFMFDDSVNIQQNTGIKIDSLDFYSLGGAAISRTYGIFGRQISMLTFALNYFANGLNPYYFKLTNVLIHLMNGLCVFAAAYLLLEAHRRHNEANLDPNTARWISLALASAWLLHPLNMTGVLYIVQRMTSLSAFFTLLGIISYTYGRLRIQESKFAWVWIVVSFIVMTPLAIFCKENGALLPAFLMLIEWIFFQFKLPTLRGKHLLIALFAVTLALPAVAILGFTVIHPDWITSAYRIREFTLGERVLTEARVLWFYVRLILAPDLTELGMYHDDIATSTSILSPITTLFSCIGIAAAAVLALLSRKRHPVASFGILFFLVGHSIESSVLPLELVYEHRNYLPMFGLLFSLLYYLLKPGKHNESKKIRALVVVAFVGMLATATFLRASIWGDAVEMKLKEVAHHPDSVRANMEVGAFYAAMPATSQEQAAEYYDNAYGYFAKASSLSPNDTLGLLSLITLNSRHSMPIEKVWITVLAQRIEKNPFQPNTVNSLVALYTCVANNECHDGVDMMAPLFQAALHNPTLRGPSKATVMFAWSDFLMKFKHDTQAGLAANYQASELAPGILDLQTIFIQHLIQAGKPAEALTEIEHARKIDSMHLHMSQLDDLEHSAKKSTLN